MSAELDTLDQQQALLTDGLRQMLEGRWVSFPSLQADIEALSPGIELAPQPPVLTSEAGPEPPAYAWNPDADMPGQVYDWTCSCCATEYVERGAGAPRGDDVYANREAVVYDVGYPHNVNSAYGLMDGSGAELQRVLADHAGIETKQGWLSYDQAYAIYSVTFGLGSGGAYYHWVVFAGVDGSSLVIRNSAWGYKGIYDRIGRDDFNRLGPWSCIWAY